MDVQDGFILGVYNYCDRWCECCQLTSRCRVFADVAISDALAAGDLKAVADAPEHPSDFRPPSKFLEEALADFDESTVPELPEPKPLSPRYLAVCERANHYADGCYDWARGHDVVQRAAAVDPLAVVFHFAWLIAAKTRRAIDGLNEDDGCRDFPPDFEGSAKVVLDGIERSITAWKGLAATGRAAPDVASRCVANLQWIESEIDALIPGARAFVRPGIDEPDEVAKLEAADWS